MHPLSLSVDGCKTSKLWKRQSVQSAYTLPLSTNDIFHEMTHESIFANHKPAHLMWTYLSLIAIFLRNEGAEKCDCCGMCLN